MNMIDCAVILLRVPHPVTPLKDFKLPLLTLHLRLRHRS